MLKLTDRVLVHLSHSSARKHTSSPLGPVPTAVSEDTPAPPLEPIPTEVLENVPVPPLGLHTAYSCVWSEVQIEISPSPNGSPVSLKFLKVSFCPVLFYVSFSLHKVACLLEPTLYFGVWVPWSVCLICLHSTLHDVGLHVRIGHTVLPSRTSEFPWFFCSFIFQYEILLSHPLKNLVYL